MKEYKYFEVKDRGTFIPVLAYKLIADNVDESYFLEMAAFYGKTYCIVTKLNNLESNYNAYNWSSSTMEIAHSYIEQNFKDLVSGDVIDVEYILGKRSTKKEKQRKEDY